MRALGRILQNINLRTVTSVTYSFDPYHQNVRSIRDMLFLLNAPKIIETNPNCKTKVTVKADRSEPNMHVTFKDGHQLIFKTQYLSTMDIAEHLSKLCAEKDPKPTETRSSLLDQTTTKRKEQAVTWIMLICVCVYFLFIVKITSNVCLYEKDYCFI